MQTLTYTQGSKRQKQTLDGPGRKRIVSANTPRSVQRDNEESDNDDEDDDDDVITIDKHEFEANIKLLKDNKLDNKNTWDINLIEYFHDMKILQAKDGGVIDFQTATTALDGCTKIISKRIDSAGLDTDTIVQLLSLKKKRIDSDEDYNENENGNGNGNAKNKNKKKIKEKVDTDTILKDFSKIKIKDSHVQVNKINPLFTKLLLEFDEGGPKSLLLNQLPLSSDSRVPFDEQSTSTPLFIQLPDNENSDNCDISMVKEEPMDEDDDDIFDEQQAETNKDAFNSTIMEVKLEEEEAVESLIASYKMDVHSEEFQSLNVCVHIEEIKKSIENAEYGKEFVNKMAEQIENESKIKDTMDDIPQFDVEYDYDVDNFDLGDNFDFDDNGNNISEATNLTTQQAQEGSYSLYRGDDTDVGGKVLLEDKSFTHQRTKTEEDAEDSKREALFMAELDERAFNTKRQNQYWKIRALKKSGILDSTNNRTSLFPNNDDTKNDNLEGNETSNLSTSEREKTKRQLQKEKKREKEKYVIDFMSDSPDTEPSKLFKKPMRNLPAINKDAINIELTTIPDLKVWNSERLVKSALKPNFKFKNFFGRKSTKVKPVLDAGAEFWANQYNDRDEASKSYPNGYDEDEDEMDKDVQDFLYEALDKGEHANDGTAHDDDDGDNIVDDFDAGGYDFDAPINDGMTEAVDSEDNPFKEGPKSELSQSTSKPWYKDTIHFERRSKKINVRLLKQNLWSSTKHQVTVVKKEHPELAHKEGTDNAENDGEVEESVVDLRLSDIVSETYQKYQGRERSDLSTSFFFICMLHIANEEGLIMNSTDDLSDMVIHAK